MRIPSALAVLLWAAALGALIQCGSNASTPGTPSTTSVVVQSTPTATPTPVPTPTPIGVIPSGLVCSPTPPPIVRMQVTIHSTDGGRIVLDSKPLVANVDDYCDRVGFGGWKFCETRAEGDPQRVACDYMVTGQAEDTQRWGPTWYYDADLCSLAPDQCANHNSEQFLVIAKDGGRFTACAQDRWPVASGGTSCGWIDVTK
jgi:hypothetical protein